MMMALYDFPQNTKFSTYLCIIMGWFSFLTFGLAKSSQNTKFSTYFKQDNVLALNFDPWSGKVFSKDQIFDLFKHGKVLAINSDP